MELCESGQLSFPGTQGAPRLLPRVGAGGDRHCPSQRRQRAEHLKPLCDFPALLIKGAAVAELGRAGAGPGRPRAEQMSVSCL